MKKLLLVTAALCALSTTVLAGETLKWHHTQHVTSFQRFEVPDAQGHVITLTRLEGLATFPDGSAAPTMVYAQGDTIDKVSQVRGYFTLKTGDGSELWLHYIGTIAPDGSSKGTDTVVGGTGKFANAKGEGTFSGTGTPQGADRVVDIENVLTLGGGTADDAKAMLVRAIAAVKADRDVALLTFQKGESGFKEGDLYPYCLRASDARGLAGPIAVQAGIDVRSLKDAKGNAYGQELYDVGKKPEGQIVEVGPYLFPKPGTTAPAVEKVSWVAHVGDLICGVGFYK
jgi:hypothetical protein